MTFTGLFPLGSTIEMVILNSKIFLEDDILPHSGSYNMYRLVFLKIFFNRTALSSDEILIRSVTK